MAFRTSRSLFYLVAVMVILVRPFFTYQMIVQENIRDAQAVNSLIQRLIKKKERHTEDFSENGDLVQVSDDKVFLPLLFAVLLRRKWVSWLNDLLGSLNNLIYTTIFQLIPSNHFYRDISRLQV